MKKTILLLAVQCFLAITLNAQNPSNRNADSLAIIETVLNYGDGFYSGDMPRMEKAIHFDLNKVWVSTLPQTGKTYLTYSTYSELIELTRAKVGFMDIDKRKIDVKVLKINDDLACAKITTARFNDYLAIIKIDGQWKIVNVLWTLGSDVPNRPVDVNFKGDAEKPEVEKTVRDLIEGIYSSDGVKVEKTLHTEFKRASLILLPQTGKSMIRRDGFGSILEATRAKMGALEKEKWNIQVNVLDCMDGMAFVELIIPSGNSYCQLAKIEGQWKIISILRKAPKRP